MKTILRAGVIALTISLFTPPIIADDDPPYADKPEEYVELNSTNFQPAKFLEYFTNLKDGPYKDHVVTVDGTMYLYKPAVNNIYVPNREMTEIVGLEHFPNLTILTINDNPLTLASLHLTPEIKKRLVHFEFSNTRLGDANGVFTIDGSEYPNLERLHCGSLKDATGTSVQTLKINGFSKLKELGCGGMSDLILEIDDASCMTVEKLGCNDTNLKVDLAKYLSLKWLTCVNNNLEENDLDLSKAPNLEELRCGSNPGLKSYFERYDFTENKKLKIFHCNDIGFTEIPNLSNLTALEQLYCHNNQLTSLNVESNANLRILQCDRNHLTELDVTKNANLVRLECSYLKELTKIDLSKNSKLSFFSSYDSSNLAEIILPEETQNLTNFLCEANALNTLNVAPYTNLKELDCSKNHLLSLDLSQNTKLEKVTVNGQTRHLGTNWQFWLGAIDSEDGGSFDAARATGFKMDDGTTADIWYPDQPNEAGEYPGRLEFPELAQVQCTYNYATQYANVPQMDVTLTRYPLGTSVEEIAADRWQVSVADGRIVVENASGIVEVYSFDGVERARIPVPDSGAVSIALPGGFYIVRNGAEAVKCRI